MKALYKPLFSVAVLGAAMFTGQAYALPSCSTVIGMTLTAPGAASEQAPDTGGCLEVDGYNLPYERLGDFGLSQDDFIALLVAQWGGQPEDWVFLGEIDNRTDNLSDQYAFDYLWNNRLVPALDQNSDHGGFSVNVAMDDRLPPGDPFNGKTLDIVSVMKPNGNGGAVPAGNINNLVDFPYPETVLAYLFSDVAISQPGTLGGTFDFRGNAASSSDYIWSGVSLFGRLSPAPTQPGVVPEPAALALVGGAAVAAALARRRARIA